MYLPFSHLMLHLLQLITVKEEEGKSLSNSYNQLVEEYQQLKLAVMELDSQVKDTWSYNYIFRV